MRLHSDTITEQDIYGALRAAGMRGVHTDVCYQTGSRNRARAFEVKLTGITSNRPPMGGSADGEKAATWDEWGMFLAALYAIDTDMLTGPGGRPAYASAEAFHAATGSRFEALTAPFQHPNHRWESDGAGTQYCKSCSATLHREHTYVKVTR